MESSMFVTAVSEALAKTSLGKQLIDEARKDMSKKRAAVFKELERARGEAVARHKPLVQAREKAEERHAAALKALRVAETELNRATFAIRSENHSNEQRCSVLEQELVALAPPEINRFLTFLDAAVDGLRHGNGPHAARVATFEAIQAARTRAEDLRRSGLGDADLITELQKLREEIQAQAQKYGPPTHDARRAAGFEIGPDAA